MLKLCETENKCEIMLQLCENKCEIMWKHNQLLNIVQSFYIYIFAMNILI